MSNNLNNQNFANVETNNQIMQDTYNALNTLESHMATGDELTESELYNCVNNIMKGLEYMDEYDNNNKKKEIENILEVFKQTNPRLQQEFTRFENT